ncbi:mitochondrial carrier, partial [Rozella allomycis CSF55]
TVKVSVQSGKPLNVKNLYSGLFASLVFTSPALSSYLLTYEETKKFLKTKKSFKDNSVTHCLSAVAAEIVSGLLWTPMDVIKQHMQVQAKSSSTMSVIQGVWQRNGLKGFFKGYGISLIVYVPHSMIYFTVYEKARGGTTLDDEC